MKKVEYNFNFANFLSFSRMFSAIPLIYFLNNIHLPNYYIYSTIVVIYIVLSDVLDGYFARKANVVTNLGKIIDPVADKVCLWSVLIFLINIYFIPFLLFFILLSIRDFVLTSFSVYLLVKHNYVSQSNVSGKIFIFIATFMIVFFIYKFNLFYSYILYFASILMLIISTISYIKEHREKIDYYESI
jgi:CDP-diacylglycerol--glycerol-3-phosphate 3-phosphatidyltransferase